MINLKTASGTAKTVPQIKVITYGSAKKKEPGEVRVKAIMTPEQYVFRKESFAGGGCAKVYAGKDPRSNHLVAIKEVAIRHKSYKGLTQEIIDYRKACVASELTLSELADRSYGPIRALSNTKGSRLYIVQGLLSGSAKDAVDWMADNAPRLPVVITVAHAAIADYRRLNAVNILHFDLHVDNICYSKQRKSIEIIDFGLSCAGEVGLPRGESEYSSPRHLMRRICTARDDLFSLGAVFGQYVLGRKIFGDVSSVGSQRNTNEKHLSATQQITFLPTDLLSQQRAFLSAAQLQYSSTYKRELLTFSRPFGQLCLDMMDMEEHDELSLDDVWRRLDAMRNNLTQAEETLVQAAWDRLPDYSPVIQNHINALETDIYRIRTGTLKAVG